MITIHYDIYISCHVTFTVNIIHCILYIIYFFHIKIVLYAVVLYSNNLFTKQYSNNIVRYVMCKH